ncbi:hypothetical protein Slin15195_G124570 [Septoria linicola]|uniref:Uncharacterized protein n=1 Tax=Septoria linicola TaxID=215465 RepID=A0A9Q9B547_9PEZI|nr:hypothetical protein Slin15195_G124570 [Septoria linicola]
MTALKHLIEHRESRMRNIDTALNEDQTGKVSALFDKWRTVVSERNLVLREASNRGSVEVEDSADMAPGYKPVEAGGHGMDTQVVRALDTEIAWLEQDTAN